MNPDKPGIKTTEFLALVVGLILVLVAGLTVDGNVVSYALDVELAKWWFGGGMAYKLSRGMAKSNARAM